MIIPNWIFFVTENFQIINWLLAALIVFFNNTRNNCNTSQFFATDPEMELFEIQRLTG